MPPRPRQRLCRRPQPTSSSPPPPSTSASSTISRASTISATRPSSPADDYPRPCPLLRRRSADVLNRLFVPQRRGDRPDLGTAARTQGAYTSSLHCRVLPPLLAATDDPLSDTFAGKHLLGAIRFDDEAVAAAPTDVVLSRQAAKLPRRPRAHPRLHYLERPRPRRPPDSPPHSHSASCSSSPSRPDGKALSDARHARAPPPPLAREQKRDVYSVETSPTSPHACSSSPIPTAPAQLVRGAVFDELDNRSLRSSITAVGGTPYVANTLAPIPQTTIAPSLLFDDIGVKRANEEQQKLPYYPPPPASER